MEYYVKAFLHMFDGQSEDIGALTPTQRWVWVGLIAFARRYPPHGYLSSGTEGGSPLPATMRRLAAWCEVSVATIHSTIKLLEDRGMLTRDKRTKHDCLMVSNWEKWQQEHGANPVLTENTDPESLFAHRTICSHTEQSVRTPNSIPPQPLVRTANTETNETNGDTGSGGTYLPQKLVRTPNSLESRKSIENQDSPRAQGNVPTSATYDPGQMSHMVTCDNPGLMQAVRETKPNWSLSQRQRFVIDLVQLGVKDEAYQWATVETLTGYLKTDPPEGAQTATSWLRHLAHLNRQKQAEPSPRPIKPTPTRDEWMEKAVARGLDFCDGRGGDLELTRNWLLSPNGGVKAKDIDEVMERVEQAAEQREEREAC